MKKIARTFYMIAVVALAFTSCKKKNDDAQSFKFNGATEQFVSTNEEGLEERVYLDGANKVQFEVGDRMMLFNITDETGSTSGAARYVVADGMVLSREIGEISGTTGGNYYAFYPGENVASTNLTNQNRAVFRLDATQYDRRDAEGKPMIPFTGSATEQKNALYMAAKDLTHTTLTDAYFDFKNICGVLSLKFYSPSGKTVKSIAITDKTFNLVGDVTLKIHEVDPVYMTTLFRNYNDSPAYMTELNAYKSRLGYQISGDVRKTVVLDCSQVAGGGVQLGQTKAEATRFFIVLRPLALLNGCDIVVTFDDDDTYEIHSTRDNRISPNIIRNISAVNVD